MNRNDLLGIMVKWINADYGKVQTNFTYFDGIDISLMNRHDNGDSIKEMVKSQNGHWIDIKEILSVAQPNWVVPQAVLDKSYVDAKAYERRYRYAAKREVYHRIIDYRNRRDHGKKYVEAKKFKGGVKDLIENGWDSTKPPLLLKFNRQLNSDGIMHGDIIIEDGNHRLAIMHANNIESDVYVKLMFNTIDNYYGHTYNEQLPYDSSIFDWTTKKLNEDAPLRYIDDKFYTDKKITPGYTPIENEI